MATTEIDNIANVKLKYNSIIIKKYFHGIKMLIPIILKLDRGVQGKNPIEIIEYYNFTNIASINMPCACRQKWRRTPHSGLTNCLV